MKLNIQRVKVSSTKIYLHIFCFSAKLSVFEPIRTARHLAVDRYMKVPWRLFNIEVRPISTFSYPWLCAVELGQVKVLMGHTFSISPRYTYIILIYYGKRIAIFFIQFGLLNIRLNAKRWYFIASFRSRINTGFPVHRQ